MNYVWLYIFVGAKHIGIPIGSSSNGTVCILPKRKQGDKHRTREKAQRAYHKHKLIHVIKLRGASSGFWAK